MVGINIRPIVFWCPISVFLVLLIASYANPEYFLQTVVQINDWILSVFSSGFAFGAFLFVLTCIWAFLSPLGKIRIGGADATPMLSRWNWFAITLNTTIAIGILFWATAEPMFHLYNPGGIASIESGSQAAREFSLVSLFMHWAFTPYAIYTVPALTFALVFHNLGKPFSLSSPISSLIGRPLPVVLTDMLDGLCLLSLLFGLSASLGAGILSISGGIDRLTAFSTGPLMLALVAAAIVIAFFVSSASGLHRGIRILSDINTKMFVVLALFVLLAGPTAQIMLLGFEALGGYAREFIPRSLLLGDFGNREWVNAWTVFNFANWLAWAPLTAMFLGRISRGYTVREFIAVNFILPATFSIIWMTIFGGSALQIEAGTPGLLKGILDQSGPEFILYGVIDQLPLAGLLAAAFIILSFLSYVTAADSNTDVLARLSMRGDYDQVPASHNIVIKLVWASLVGAAAWVMVTFSGINGVKMLSNLGGLPALFIIGIFNVALIKLGTVKLKTL